MSKVTRIGGKDAVFASIMCVAAVCAAKPAVERMDRSKLLIGAYCLQANAKTDAHPAKFDIVFNVKAKRVEAFGGSGAIPVARRPDGSYVVPLASCQGVLIVLQ